MADTELIIERTQQWIEQVVIGYDLCPFATQPFKNRTIEYVVTNTKGLEQALHLFADTALSLNNGKDKSKSKSNNNAYETSLVIFSHGFLDFDAFLELIDLADQLLDDLCLSDKLLLAHFHPDYCFEGADLDEAANYSNRSVYPMLHLLKQDSVSAVSKSAINLESIPHNNIKRLREVGVHSLSSKLATLSKT